MKKIILFLFVLLLSGSNVLCADSDSTNNEDKNSTPEINTASPSSPNLTSQVEEYKTKIMENPDIMNNVKELTMDPQFQEVMKDPEVMQAVQSKDMQTLMANKKFMTLINNSKIQEINKKIKEGNQTN